MTAKSNILEGLHVLLVSEDEARISSLAKALRDRKASVGDVKAQARESLQLRGADLVVVDTRSLDATKARVNDMRADVRARWASIAQLDYAKLVLDDGAVMFADLEAAVAPLVTADKELTERARREEAFEISLRPLGPSRMLRALAAAGPTMHVEIFHETLSGVVDLSNELLVCAFAERGTSEKWEAWTALVRILGLLDATVKVSRRSHPSAMNIMEPIDQALEVAAQERHSSAEMIAMEERTARARVADDGARTGSHPAMRADGTPVVLEAEPEPPQLAPEKVSPKRTLLGVAAPGAESRTPSMAKPPAQSRYAYHADAAPEKVAPKRTLLGVAPGALPALGGMPRPVVNLAVPNIAKMPSNEPKPAAAQKAAPAPMLTEPAPPPRHFVEEVPTDKHPVMLEVARAAFAASDEQASTREIEGLDRNETRTVPFAAVADDEEDRPTTIPPSEPSDDLQVEDQATMIGSSRELLALREAAANDTLGHPDQPDDSGLPDLMQSEPPTATIEPQPSLLAAITEEVATAGFSDPPGAKPMDTTRKKREPVPQLVTRLAREPRTRVLLLILLGAVIEFYVVTWLAQRNEEMEAKIVAKSAPSAARAPVKPAAPAEPAPPQPAAAPTAPPAQDTAAATPAPTPQQDPAPAPTPGTAVAAPQEPTAPVEVKPVAVTPTPEPEKPEAQKPETAPGPAQPSEEPTAGGADDFVRNGAKLLASGNSAGARDEFARAVAADGKNAHARSGLAEALLSLGQPQDALTQIDEAIKLRPKRAHYRVVQGDALQALGKPSLAKDSWQKALEIDGNDREAKKRLGQ